MLASFFLFVCSLNTDLEYLQYFLLSLFVYRSTHILSVPLDFSSCSFLNWAHVHFVCFLFIQAREQQMTDGLKLHNKHDKDDNNVSLAMQRIKLMGSRYAGRQWI